MPSGAKQIFFQTHHWLAKLLQLHKFVPERDTVEMMSILHTPPYIIMIMASPLINDFTLKYFLKDERLCNIIHSIQQVIIISYLKLATCIHLH